MPYKNLDKLMDTITIVVVKKFLFIKKTYTVTILYTPHKKRIYKIQSENKVPFYLGDNISTVIDWCESKKYDYNITKGKYNGV